ncbi:uncharacterized protein LACBIDRAFT_314504 [Laccaria bicolor S238N-H82]|uniref:Predicted protein n=1 Tax=Laccaria bicolor (strain S238N-H82 / ATCC MYA-4686) TaxID=486041 RepID=B0DYP9_LACBS|nr:uncharacterized protein LACBIDRAFT_314504 [Laccaria bicolor S238N-H82]EDR00284.1 predicted protein [Laccaria bicolor S238N-H82]|eukprot:XP_001889036.1 predicted protein [Laccaria bicolor S238N-H82]
MGSSTIKLWGMFEGLIWTFEGEGEWGDTVYTVSMCHGWEDMSMRARLKERRALGVAKNVGDA